MKPKKFEWILLFLLIAGLSLWAFWPKSAGNTVTITADGSEAGRYSLLKDITVPVKGYGDFTLTLVVENGQAQVEGSTCPDLICQQHRPISRAGEQIICLPARVVISVIGEEAEYDAIVG